MPCACCLCLAHAALAVCIPLRSTHALCLLRPPLPQAASAAAASDSAAAREQRIAAGAEASTSGGRDTPLSSIDWGAAGLQPVPYKLMAGLASVGAAETGYLTLSKILHSDVACPSDGCASVLSSPYAQIFGVPLPLWGMLAYGAVAALAVTADNWADATETEPPRVIDTALLAGSAVLGTASATLMYILATALDGASCIYCYTSASLSAALLACMLTSLDKRVLVDAAAPGLVTVATTAAALYISYAPALAQATGADFELPYAPPAVTAESSSRAVTLAERLHAAGAKMYGAFWCSHCFDQKQAFGKQAMAEFPYVECYPDGWKRVRGWLWVFFLIYKLAMGVARMWARACETAAGVWHRAAAPAVPAAQPPVTSPLQRAAWRAPMCAPHTHSTAYPPPPHTHTITTHPAAGHSHQPHLRRGGRQGLPHMGDQWPRRGG